ncbi:hypothetical protein LQ318_11700 [Aliifodinibius salicampi]|uniref:HNH endonuclease n=1 Tax=Fodinibius salicampi TaxID=1920655 RepID=A0ABT3Q0C8_9BACT|nr:hypothetical protein [Fodinibius salicampi]MCW9713565.1 hypothetical protein [Fodinibius salicampi]
MLFESYRFEKTEINEKRSIKLPSDGLKARHLEFDECNKIYAVNINKRWHSRLPNSQEKPWQFAFKAHFRGVTFAIALWNNPSARTLPNNWLELRRLACSNDAPKNTPSRFMAHMVNFFRDNCPEKEKCISYQDTSVHEGTIYKAAGWEVGHITKARKRKRDYKKPGTDRLYRKDSNGKDVASARKLRWEKEL